MSTGIDDLLPPLRRLGLISGAPEVEPLTGGVASDIWLVREGGRSFVVKRALAKLRVAAEWHVPVSRNSAEAAWLQLAGEAAPGAAPRLIAHDAEHGFFVMEHLDAGSHPVWKSELREGRADPRFAADVGAALAAIHRATAGRVELAAGFNTDAIFRAIRLEPYLEYTAARHPAVAAALFALSDRTLSTKRALVHGDVSPKNILVGPAGPVLLDAECAWYGDPAFDLAFALNHLLLKGLWNGAALAEFVACFEALAGAYLARIDWEPREALEARASALLPALMLARIDGKSPVEYLTAEADKQQVRNFALTRLARPPVPLTHVSRDWAAILAPEA